MKIKLVDYTGPDEDKEDITIGNTYNVIYEHIDGEIDIIDDTGERHCIEHGNYEHVDHADKEPKQSDLKSLQNLTGKVRVLEDEDALITIFETEDEIYVMEFEYK